MIEHLKIGQKVFDNDLGWGTTIGKDIDELSRQETFVVRFDYCERYDHPSTTQIYLDNGVRLDNPSKGVMISDIEDLPCEMCGK